MMGVQLGRNNLIIALCGSVCLFGVANYLHLQRRVTCADCRFPYGVPFTFWQDGGFAGDAGLVWVGIAGDFLAVLVIAAGAAWTLEWLTRKF